MLKRLLLAALIAVLPATVLAQSTVLQGGGTVAGHLPTYSGTGSGTNPIVIDSGNASGATGNGVGVSEFLQVNRSGNGDTTAPYASNGTGPLSTHNCFYDAPISNSTGYHYLCLDANSQGATLLATGSGGTATPLDFIINVNGVAYNFPDDIPIIPQPYISGSIPYFNSTTTIADSALLGANELMIGGGAGGAPSTLGTKGTTTTLLHGNASGAPTFGAVSLTADVTGMLPVASGGTGDATLTIHGVLIGQGTSAIAATTAGTVGQALISGGASADPAFGTVGVPGGGTGIASGTSGGVPYFSSGTTIASSNALTANLPVFGGGAATAPFSGTISGNTTKVASASGSFVTGNCLKADAGGNIVDNGSACGSGGSLTIGTTTIGSGTDGRILFDNASVLGEKTVTGSGSVALATSPTLVTPVLGVATATSINKVAITAPAASATLTLADGSTLATSGGFSTTLTATGATNVTLPTSGTLLTNALTSAHLLVGSAGAVATDVALSGDATLSNAGALTLATVNSNVGSFTAANITVNAKGLITAAANGTGAVNDMVLIQDQATSGSAGNTYISGAWRTVVLDTEVVDTGSVASLSSNQVTLLAGSYEFDGMVIGVGQAGGPTNTRLRLRNTSDSTTVNQGPNGNAPAENFPSVNYISGSFTIAGTKTFELQIWVNGIGIVQNAATSGDVEVYSHLHLRRFAT